MFHQLREKMKQRVVLKKKKSDPEKFVVPCIIGGQSNANALCDTGSSVSIMPRVMADQVSLKIGPSGDSFTFVDCSKVNSGGIVKNLLVQIVNALVLLDFHVMDIQIYWNSSLLHGRIFMARQSDVLDIEIRDDRRFVTVCYSDSSAEREDDGEVSIDNQPASVANPPRRKTV